MDENPGLSEGFRMASAWPPFVALGLPIAEIGILFGLVPIAVGGLLLFCGSIAGMASEAGYASSAWRALAVVSVFVAAGGVALLYANSLTDLDLSLRAYSMLGAAALMLLAGIGGELFAVGPEPDL